MQSVQMDAGKKESSGAVPPVRNIKVSDKDAKKMPVKISTVSSKPRVDVSIEIVGDDWAYYKSDN